MLLLRTGRPVGRGLTAMLLGFVVWVAFAVLAPGAWAQSVSLSQRSGPVGTEVTATGTGFTGCVAGASAVLLWNGSTPAGGTASVNSAETVTGTMTVPATAPGEYTITLKCAVKPVLKETSEPIKWVTGSAAFVVEEDTAAENADLTLDTQRGQVDSAFTAYGTGFACSGGEAVLAWDDGTRLATALTGPAGDFEQPVTVPSDASPGEHTVEAYCARNTEVGDREAFTVDGGGGGGATDGPTLTLDPGSGAAGEPVEAVGTGFSCDAGDVELAWEGASLPVSTAVDPAGDFAEVVSVPAEAQAGTLTLTATCPAFPEMTDDAAFTVEPTGGGGGNGNGNGGGGGGNGNGDDGNGAGGGVGSGSTNPAAVVGPALGGGVLLAAGAAYLLNSRRGPRWADRHIRLEPHPAGAAGAVLIEHTDRAGPSRTVRLEPRPAPGNPTIEETDP
ncbi:hypothetical protein [Kitasatospora sp. NPDC051914]|uniref:hypothetical protein n=1 Tax=Kitasatospora sp. NPDC051914 TaxID=3154945 RepID=UPI00342E891D